MLDKLGQLLYTLLVSCILLVSSACGTIYNVYPFGKSLWKLKGSLVRLTLIYRLGRYYVSR
jgi:hypothetical protein